uniref:Uncharacterized protein n=1 Tax=Globodera rostochiensis TaxID=31243 RepID=A0A914IEQ4_GLORO
MMGVPTFRRLTFRRRDTSSTKQKYISSTKPKTTLRRRSQKRHFVDEAKNDTSSTRHFVEWNFVEFLN